MEVSDPCFSPVRLSPIPQPPVLCVEVSPVPAATPGFAVKRSRPSNTARAAIGRGYSTDGPVVLSVEPQPIPPEPPPHSTTPPPTSLDPTALTSRPLVLSETELLAVRQATVIANMYASVQRRSGLTATSADLPAVTETNIDALVLLAIAANAESFGVEAAKAWADGFLFPPEARSDDAALFYTNASDFNRFHDAKRAKAAGNRLSLDRITFEVDRALLTDAKDWGRLRRIASGIVIQTPVGFTPCASRPPLRPKYAMEVSHAVNKLLYTQWVKGTVVLLPIELATVIRGLHWSSQHWTTKAGKACGRSLCDCSNCEVQFGMPVNGKSKTDKKALAKRLIRSWGVIKHPTLADLALMVWEACLVHGSANLELWKMDLASAFNLMDFSPESSKLLAFELTEGMFALHTTGMFGWAGTPYVFQVITRVLQDMIQPKISGRCLYYVDDLMGISLTANVAADMGVAATKARGLLGPLAVADDKSEHARNMVFLGWEFNLNTLTVAMSEKNMLKMVYTFYCCDINGTFTKRQVQRMASLASRYSVLCTPMRIYTNELHKVSATFDCPNDKRRLSDVAKSDVIMWRAYLVLLEFDPRRSARLLSTFQPREPTVLIEYDASLQGLGVGVGVWCPINLKFQLVVYAQLVIPFPVTDDSSFQNTDEYLALMLGLLLVKETACVSPGFAYNVIGDNTTSLSWCRREKASSTLARRACIGFSILSVELDAVPANMKHIKGEDNYVYDGLSRGKRGVDLGLPSELELILTPHSMAVRYITLCNPNIKMAVVEDHTDLSLNFLTLLRERGCGGSGVDGVGLSESV